MKNRVVSLILALGLLLSLTSCAAAPKPTVIAPGTQPPAAPAPTASVTVDTTSVPPQRGARMFTDSVGREIELPVSLERIAVSGPMAQMALIALCPEKLVGIAAEFDEGAEQFIPPEYYNLPLLGQLYGSDIAINLEELAMINPQVIIDVGEPKKTVKEDLDGLTEQVGIPSVHITATLATMADAYRLLGELVGEPERAERIAQYCERVYGRGMMIASSLGEHAPTVLYCLGETGMNVLAKGAFHSELLDLMSNNIAIVDEPSARGTGNETDMEQLMLWDPDVIFFAPEVNYEEIGNDPVWQQLAAVKNGSYYRVPAGPYNWMGNPPAVNRYLGILWMPVILYPDLVDYDLYEETREYYELFYHADLTLEQFDELTSGSIPGAV